MHSHARARTGLFALPVGVSRRLWRTIAFGGGELTFVIHQAIVTFEHPAPDTAANGVLAGVLDTEEFILGFKSAAAQISTSLCGTQFDGIAQQIRQRTTPVEL